MPQSKQEELVQTVLSMTLGASLMFAPDKWQGTTHEPFDIAWQCDDVVYLIELHESSRESFKKLDEHNQKRLRGSIRRWNMERHLTGRNNFRQFDLQFDDARHHVLLSIVAGPSEMGLWHQMPSPRPPHFERVAFSITLPAGVFRHLLEKSAGMHTILDLALWMRDQGRELTTPELMAWVNNRHRIAASQAEQQVGPFQKGLLSAASRALLVKLMTVRPSGASTAPDDVMTYHMGGTGGMIEMVNDLTWREMMVLVSAISIVVRQWFEALAAGRDRIPEPYATIEPRSGACFVVTSQIATGRAEMADHAREYLMRAMAAPVMPNLRSFGFVGIHIGVYRDGGEPQLATTVNLRTEPTRLSQRLSRLR